MKSVCQRYLKLHKVNCGIFSNQIIYIILYLLELFLFPLFKKNIINTHFYKHLQKIIQNGIRTRGPDRVKVMS